MTKSLKIKLPIPLRQKLSKYSKEKQINLNDLLILMIDTNLEFFHSKVAGINIRVFDFLLLLTDKPFTLTQSEKEMILKIDLRERIDSWEV